MNSNNTYSVSSVGKERGQINSSPRERSPDQREVGGSSPSPSTKFRRTFRFKWAEELRCSVGVYVRRWYLETPFGSIRVHHWLHSDDDRAFHDHPWWFITFVLRGGYRDCSPAGEERMQAPKIAFRPANHAHTVKVNKGGAWTVLVTGPQVRRWGFWVGKKWKKSNKYFLEHGMHICD